MVRSDARISMEYWLECTDCSCYSAYGRTYHLQRLHSDTSISHSLIQHQHRICSTGTAIGTVTNWGSVVEDQLSALVKWRASWLNLYSRSSSHLTCSPLLMCPVPMTNGVAFNGPPNDFARSWSLPSLSNEF